MIGQELKCVFWQHRFECPNVFFSTWRFTTTAVVKLQSLFSLLSSLLLLLLLLIISLLSLEPAKPIDFWNQLFSREHRNIGTRFLAVEAQSKPSKSCDQYSWKVHPTNPWKPQMRTYRQTNLRSLDIKQYTCYEQQYTVSEAPHTTCMHTPLHPNTCSNHLTNMYTNTPTHTHIHIKHTQNKSEHPNMPLHYCYYYYFHHYYSHYYLYYYYYYHYYYYPHHYYH